MKLNYLYLIIIIIISACSQPEDVLPDPPQAVQMVLRALGADTLDIERGIDAENPEPNALNGIQLDWYKHPNHKDLQEYRIYRSEYPSGLVNFQYHASKEVNQTGIIDTMFIDTQDLSMNVRYYYYIAAMDKDDQVGQASDTVSYKLIEKAYRLKIIGEQEIKEPNIIFQWDRSESASEYILRIEEYQGDYHKLVYSELFAPPDYRMPQEHNLSGDWMKATFPDRDYRWRIDCVVAEDMEDIWAQSFEGSESDWAAFTVKWSN